MFRRIAMLLAITTVLLLAVIALNLTSLSTARAQDNATATQKWEYGIVYLNVNQGLVIVGAPTEDEQKSIEGDIADIPKQQLGAISVFNVMGDYGWELVSDNYATAFATYTFKRPASGS